MVVMASGDYLYPVSSDYVIERLIAVIIFFFWFFTFSEFLLGVSHISISS